MLHMVLEAAAAGREFGVPAPRTAVQKATASNTATITAKSPQKAVKIPKSANETVTTSVIQSRPVKASPPARMPKESKKLETAIQIILDETGVSRSDITDTTPFVDIGVDSLLSMVISSRLREELGLDLETENAMFLSYPTIKHLREAIEQGEASSNEIEIVAEPAQEEKTNFSAVRDTVTTVTKIIPRDVAKPKQSGKFEAAIQVILDETGVARSDVTDETIFVDIGVDSLLSMVISSRLREELDLDLETENAMFLSYPTIKHIREAIDQTEDDDSVDDLKEIEMVDELRESRAAPESAPQSTTVAVGQVIAAPKIAPEVSSPKVTDAKFNAAIQIILDETGVSRGDVLDSTAFADIGVDSLLSMVISSRMREELDLDLETENAMFLSYPTIKHLREVIAQSDDSVSSSDGEDWTADTPETELLYSEAMPVSTFKLPAIDTAVAPEEFVEDSEPETLVSCRPAASFILQGFPKTAKKTLFLLPDGGGSSSSYAPIPRVDADVSIIGLNCPYARDPENMTCSIQALMRSYVNEIQRRQPHGPYHIGGWSSGGVMSYIAVQLLMEAGEEVRTLIIFDSPRPGTMDLLPPHFYDYCRDIGLFGKVPPPPFLVPHFDATVEVLDGYRIKPLPQTVQPLRLAIIWATESVAEGQGKPKFPTLPHNSVGLEFMIDKRKDFGPSGWESLVPNVEVVMGKVDANHFSMMVSYIPKVTL